MSPSTALRSILLATLLLAAGSGAARATVRVSNDDGAWGAIYWSPEGVPRGGDTIIIATDVTGMPSGEYGRLIIKATGSLRIDAGEPRVNGLLNYGRLICVRPAALVIAGDVVNNGTIGGDGVLRMARGGAVISGGGTYRNLAVGSAPGTAIYLANDITIASLSLAPGNRLIVGDNNLTVNGAYNSGSAFGEPGIEVTTGAVYLNGLVYGSADGRVILGRDSTVPLSKRAAPPEVYGTLGDSTGGVRIAASRLIGYSVLLGDVRIDSSATLEATGIGDGGVNRIAGTLRVEGTLSGGDDGRTWIIDGDLYNTGSIESCVLAMSGHRARLRCDSGAWDPAISLTYTGGSGDELAVEGALVLSHLTIAARTPLDSDIVVRAAGNPVRIRHGFASDTARNCRLVSDTVVSIWGAASGIVEGSVVFEGFWGSPIAGRYGAPGRTVRMGARKSIAGEIDVAGAFVCDAQSPMVVASPLRIGGDAEIRGEVTVPEGSVILAGGNLQCLRPLRGGGTLALAGANPLLDMAMGVADSALLEIGTDTVPSAVLLRRTVPAPRLTIHPGSSISTHAADSLLITRELRYGVRYIGDYNTASAAVVPADRSPGAFFGGATSILRYINSYVAADSITVGTGYYVRFAADTIIWQAGLPANLPLNVPLVAGWNLIGGASVPVRADRITVSGTTLLSDFVTALGGAERAPILEPGRGYWVNAAGVGSITFNGEP